MVYYPQSFAARIDQAPFAHEESALPRDEVIEAAAWEHLRAWVSSDASLALKTLREFDPFPVKMLFLCYIIFNFLFPF